MADAVSISLAGVSTIACIYLEVLLYYKMWHTFIYHLIGVLATIVVYVYVAIRAYDEHTGVVILASLFSVAFLVNFVFTTLTLVPLCCRACGNNLCMKTAATIESHRKALREILPLFILIVPSFLVCLVISGVIV